MKYYPLILTLLWSTFLIQTNQASFTFCVEKEKGSYSIPAIKKSHPPSPVQKNIYDINLRTSSGIVVPATFFDRNSSIALIVGSGLPASKESMHIFAALFSTFDVIVFDYRWNKCYLSLLLSSFLRGKLIKNILLDETEELEAVVDFIYNKKDYTHVVGLGECYSCFHLLKVQSERSIKHKKAFTHLILDSCWYSLKDLAKQVCFDPLLAINPQYGGCPTVIRYVTQSALFKKLSLGLFFSIVKNVSIKPYLATVNIPLLFIHGDQDLFVPTKHFNKIWNATSAQHAYVLHTPYHHSDNLHNHYIYRYVAEKFITSQSSTELAQAIISLASCIEGA